MSEYIDRELLARSVAVKKVQERLTGRKTAEQLNGYNPTSFLVGFEDGMQTALDIIFAQPSADVVEVKHGYWFDIYKGGSKKGCSVCRCRADLSKQGKEYCSHCGAIMDGKT